MPRHLARFAEDPDYLVGRPVTVTQVTLGRSQLRYVAQFSASIQLAARIFVTNLNEPISKRCVMYRKSLNILIALALVGLSGCASMSGDECATSDWSAVGYEDGSRGYSSDRFGNHRKACAKHGVTADFAAYQAGRNQGLVEFCQPSKGFNLGASGGRYNGVCAADVEPDFLDAYRVGQQLYSLRSSVSSANSQIYAREHEIDDIEIAVRNKEALLISADTTTGDRVLLLADLKRLSERTGELEAEIEMLIADRARAEQDLQHYEQTVAAFGF
jgi:hypothetical protein